MLIVTPTERPAMTTAEIIANALVDDAASAVLPPHADANYRLSKWQHDRILDHVDTRLDDADPTRIDILPVWNAACAILAARCA